MPLKWPPRQAVGRFCCITMARDEEVFLEHFLDHYERHLDDVSFIIVDHASRVPVRQWVAGRANADRINVITLPDIPFDADYKAATLSALAGIALGGWSTVIATDTDEIVVPLRPTETADLAALIEAEVGNFIAPLGMEFIHDPASEGNFDPRQPLLVQRQFLRFNSAYCKPAIWRSAAATFEAGQHRLNTAYCFSKRLGLAHLKYVDRPYLEARHQMRSALTLSEAHKAKKRGGAWRQTRRMRQEFIDTFASVAEPATGPAAHEVLAAFERDLLASLDRRGRQAFGIISKPVTYASLAIGDSLPQ